MTPTLRQHLETIRDRFDHERIGPPEWHENCVSCATYADATAALAILDQAEAVPFSHGDGTTTTGRLVIDA